MKTILLFLTILLFSFDGDMPIYGKWELVGLTRDGKEIELKKDTYFATFQENELSFNKAVNKCKAQAQITDNNIILSSIACTKACCDENVDPISATFYYQGEYSIEGMVLTITSSDSKYTFIKID